MTEFMKAVAIKVTPVQSYRLGGASSEDQYFDLYNSIESTILSIWPAYVGNIKYFKNSARILLATLVGHLTYKAFGLSIMQSSLSTITYSGDCKKITS